MKFPTPEGIGGVCGDQKKARRYYQTSMPPPNKRPCEQVRKRGRESHMEINIVNGEVDEDNSSKERESATADQARDPHDPSSYNTPVPSSGSRRERLSHTFPRRTISTRLAKIIESLVIESPADDCSPSIL
ncbi:hypothetical protein LIER_39752 [Lithospermum erythrorhizon]|uniref:Uncharacterized protein n=1 Tax=Lithospermum erythrorhizon TaxID=34254 RepID=A0AAV3QML5_LITER